MDGTGFDHWATDTRPQDDPDHVMIPDDEICLFQNQYTMQPFENLSGYGRKQNLQALDYGALNLSQQQGALNLSQPHGSAPHTSKSSHYRVPQTQASSTLPHACQKLDVASLGYQSQSINPRDLFLSNMSGEPPSIPNSSTSSTSFDLPALTNSSSISGLSHNQHAPPSNKFLQASKLQSRRFPSFRSCSSFSDTPIKQRKINASTGKRSPRAAQPKKALAQLEEALKPQYSKLSEGFQHTLQLLKLLMDKEIADGNLEVDFDETSITTPSSTQYCLDASEASDCVHSNENDPSDFSTPLPQTRDAQEATPIDTELEIPVRYYCTYPSCKVSQKECKGRHKKCQCPVNRETYWSTSKVDIKRHEEGLEHYPKETFVCFECFVVDVWGASCAFCATPILDDPKTHYMQCERARANTKSFSRKDHLLEHLRRQHGSKNMGEETKSWSFRVDSDWPRQCGFCTVMFDSWDQRMSHIAWHFDHGARIRDWKFPPVKPKARKPPDSFLRNRKDEDDDDNDDGFGGSGSGSRGKLTGDGSFAGATQQTQHGQSSSSPEYGSYSHQGYYQQGYRQSEQHVNAAIQAASECQTPQTLRGSVKLSLALERYLKDPGDRVPGLWTALRTAEKQPMPLVQSCVPITLARKTILTSDGKHTNSTARGAILLSARPGGGKTFLVRQLVRQYIRVHWNDLDQGIFWVNARIRPEVKDSFLDITLQTVVSLPKNARLMSPFFHSWWQNTGQSLPRTPSGLGPPWLSAILDYVMISWGATSSNSMSAQTTIKVNFLSEIILPSLLAIPPDQQILEKCDVIQGLLGVSKKLDNHGNLIAEAFRLMASSLLITSGRSDNLSRLSHDTDQPLRNCDLPSWVPNLSPMIRHTSRKLTGNSLQNLPKTWHQRSEPDRILLPSNDVDWYDSSVKEIKPSTSFMHGWDPSLILPVFKFCIPRDPPNGLLEDIYASYGLIEDISVVSRRARARWSTRRRSSAEHKAKSALMRHLGSFLACRSRRVHEHERPEYAMSSLRFNDPGNTDPADHAVHETLRNTNRGLSKTNYHFSEDAIHTHPSPSTSRKEEKATTVGKNEPRSLQVIKTIISEETGVAFEALSDTDELVTLGMDSLMLLVILSRLREHSEADLPGSFLVDCTTIGTVASKLDALAYDQRLDKFGRAIDAKSNSSVNIAPLESLTAMRERLTSYEAYTIRKAAVRRNPEERAGWTVVVETTIPPSHENIPKVDRNLGRSKQSAQQKEDILVPFQRRQPRQENCLQDRLKTAGNDFEWSPAEVDSDQLIDKGRKDTTSIRRAAFHDPSPIGHSNVIKRNERAILEQIDAPPRPKYSLTEEWTCTSFYNPLLFSCRPPVYNQVDFRGMDLRGTATLLQYHGPESSASFIASIHCSNDPAHGPHNDFQRIVPDVGCNERRTWLSTYLHAEVPYETGRFPEDATMEPQQQLETTSSTFRFLQHNTCMHPWTAPNKRRKLSLD